MDYFILDGVDSRDYGIYLHNGRGQRERSISPPKTQAVNRIIGKSGRALFDEEFDSKTFDLSIYSEVQLTNSDIRMISAWLNKLGTRKLILSYESYKYYNVVTANQLDVNEYMNGFTGQITYVALSPIGLSVFSTEDIEDNGLNYDEGYLYDSGLLYAEDMGDYLYSSITSGDDFAIYHGGNCDLALPNIVFTGTATTLKIEQFSDAGLTNKIGENNYGSFTGTLEINSLLDNVFLDGVMSNNTFDGEFINLLGRDKPELDTSGTIQAYAGSIVTLNSLASAINDAYNGLTIYLEKYNGDRVGYEITDYVGSTKQATLNSTIDADVEVGGNYRIYSKTDGFNYFRITGTGFSGLSVRFNFRYAYI